MQGTLELCSFYFYNFANIDNKKIYEDAFCAVIKLVRYKHDGDLPKLRKGQHLEQLITYDWGVYVSEKVTQQHN